MPAPKTKVDLGAALSAAQAVRLLPNASGDFSETVSPSPSASWLSGIADLDGDGAADLILGAPGDDDRPLHV